MATGSIPRTPDQNRKFNFPGTMLPCTATTTPVRGPLRIRYDPRYLPTYVPKFPHQNTKLCDFVRGVVVGSFFRNLPSFRVLLLPKFWKLPVTMAAGLVVKIVVGTVRAEEPRGAQCVHTHLYQLTSRLNTPCPGLARRRSRATGLYFSAADKREQQ